MMKRTKKLVATLLCVVMTAAFVPAFAVGAESTTLTAVRTAFFNSASEWAYGDSYNNSTGDNVLAASNGSDGWQAASTFTDEDGTVTNQTSLSGTGFATPRNALIAFTIPEDFDADSVKSVTLGMTIKSVKQVTSGVRLAVYGNSLEGTWNLDTGRAAFTGSSDASVSGLSNLTCLGLTDAISTGNQTDESASGETITLSSQALASYVKEMAAAGYTEVTFRLATPLGGIRIYSYNTDYAPTLTFSTEEIPDSEEKSETEMSVPSVGDGSEDNPYQIGTAEELLWFANMVNNQHKTSICAILTADIAINPGTFNTGGNYTPYASESVVEWTPIGTETYRYTGVFDGQNHVISGIYFDDETVSDVGLFAYIFEGTIKNLGITNSYLRGAYYVGGIVGNSDDGNITNCFNGATVSGKGTVGGIVGTSDGEISKCVNSGYISANGGGRCGGIAGFSWNIDDCYNTGKIAGVVGNEVEVAGIVGYGSDVNNCYNIGTVTCSKGEVTSINTFHNTNNCYYLKNTAIGAEIVTTGTEMEIEDFTSGKVAYLLQQGHSDQSTTIWGQYIGYEDYPSLGGKKVYYNSTVDEYYNINGISLDASSLTLEINEGAALTATLSPSAAQASDIDWSSSNIYVATVSSSGKIFAVGVGTTVITAAVSGLTATCVVTVTEKTTSVVWVSLDKTTLSLEEGETAQLSAEILPSDATNTNVTWESSDESVATVADGKVTAVSAGEAEITVTTEDGGYTAACTVTVTAVVIPVTGVTLSSTTLSMTKGESAELTATVKPDNATDKTVTWESSDESVATVQDGVVTAVGRGTAVITASAGGYTAECEVTVSAPEVEVGSVSAYAGENVTIPITIADNPGIAGFRFKITYDKDVLTPVSVAKGAILTSGTLTSNIQQGGDMSSYEYIIAYYENTTNITSDGVILNVTFTVNSGAAEGETAVEITYEEGDVVTQNYDYVDLGVVNGAVNVKKVVHVTAVTLSETEAEMTVGEELTLTATAAPTNATYPAVTWESSDESVASVKNGVVTALKTGSATITATADGVSASCSVSVKSKYYANIKVENAAGYAGETVTVPIVISNNPGIAGLRLKIAYDSDILTPVLVEKGDVLTEGTLTSNTASYEYIIAYYENTTNVTEDGVILYVTFAIDADAAEGSTPIEISCESGDVVTQDYEDVELNITNGAVEVRRIVKVTGVKLDKSTITMVKGKTATLAAEVSPSDATNTGVTWASSDESVASVSNGVVTALKAGSAVITVTTEDGGFTASCTVTVTVPAESVELSETEITLIPGKTATITASVLPSDTTDTIVTWASSNESVATVEDGIITAIAPGSAEITAIAGSASAVCTVTVREVMKGDVHDDSRVNAADGVRLRQYLAQWALNLSDYELAAADVNVDDSINAKDGVLLRRYLSGWSTTLSSMSLMSMNLLEENNLTIEVDNVTGKAGDYVYVPIMITNNPGVTAFNLLINFDKTALTPVSITTGEALSTGSIESNVNDTSIDLTELNYVTVYYENVSNDYGTGVLCTVKFVISGDAEGENEISLTLIEAYDEELEDMEVDMSAGFVTVEGAVDTYYTINSVSSAGEISVTKEKPYNVGGVLIVAKYADGALIDKEVIEMSDMSDGETKVIQSSLTAGEGEILKAFIWRSVSDMRALSNVVK